MYLKLKPTFRRHWFNALSRSQALGISDDCRIHSMVHVSQLKDHVPQSVVVESDLGTLATDTLLVLTSASFQKTRLIRHGASTIAQT